MPDWNASLHERMSDLELPEAEREEVIAELASHLQESYDLFLQRGLSEAAALKQARVGLGDLELLTQNIYRAKQEERNMSGITRRLWLPGFFSMIAIAMMFLAVIKAGLPRHLIGSVMLVGLPFAGALGAYLSRRAGAGCWAIVSSGLFPAAAMLAAVMLVIIVGAILGWPVPATEYKTLGSVMVGYTLGLAAGIVPFLRAQKTSGMSRG